MCDLFPSIDPTSGCWRVLVTGGRAPKTLFSGSEAGARRRYEEVCLVLVCGEARLVTPNGRIKAMFGRRLSRVSRRRPA